MLFAAAHLTAWSLLDRRPLNDHDRMFAGPASVAAAEFEGGDRLGALHRQLLRSPSRHPQLAQTTLVAVTGTFGWTRGVVRLANLPWLLLLVLGVWGAVREVQGPRLALLAAWLAASLPVVVHMSRKWFIHFHTAALAAVGLWIVLAIVRREERVGWGWWLGLGAVAGLRIHTHPVDLPDVALSWALAVGFTAAAVGRRAVLGGLVAAAIALLMGAPFVLGGAAGSADASSYAARAATWLDPAGSGAMGWGEALVASVRMLFVQWWMPPAFLLVFLPGLVGLALGWRRMPRGKRRLVAVPVVLLTVQVPLALLAFRNFGYLADWLFLLPATLVLALSGLGAWSNRVPGPLRGLWTVLVVVQGVAVVAIPLAASSPGREWFTDPPDSPWIQPFLSSEHGGVYVTHHVALRRNLVGGRLATVLAARDDPTELGLLDLSLQVCEGTSVARWWPPDDAHPPPGLADDLFGFVGLPVPEFADGADGRTAGLTVVRLWRLGEPCSGDPLAIAGVRAKERFGPGAQIETLDDHAQQLIGNATPGLSPDPHYLNAALIVVLEP